MKLKHKFTKSNRTSVFEMFGGIEWQPIHQELERWENGTNGYITLHKEGKLKSAEQLGYYYGKILPMAFENFKEDHLSKINFSITSSKGREKMVEMPV